MPRGTVVKIVRAKYFVNIKGQNAPISAILPGKYKKDKKFGHSIVNVGDSVNIESSKDDWIINEVFERKNKISRISPQNRNHERILVTNVDQMLIVGSAMEPKFNARLIDRYLVVATKYKIPATIIVNKIDLLDKEDPFYKDTGKRFEKTGAEVIFLSIHRKELKKVLVKIIQGKINVFVGSSGVGKSSIINFLDKETKIKVGSVSDAHDKGRHTTTTVQMHYLKKYDTYIVDTPGIREFGLFDLGADELENYFPEFGDCRQKCKFNNCLHIHEPGCAIKNEVDLGTINSERYESYLTIYRSIKNEFKGY